MKTRQDYHLNADADTGSGVREEGRARSGTVSIRPARTAGPPATAAAVVCGKVRECKAPNITPKPQNGLIKRTTSCSLRNTSKELWSYLLWQFLVIELARLTKSSWRCGARGHKPGRGGSAEGRVLEAEVQKDGRADAPYAPCHACVPWPGAVPQAHRPIHACRAPRRLNRSCTLQPRRGMSCSNRFDSPQRELRFSLG